MNTHLEGEEVDCHWPDRMLVVEVDGPGHRDRPPARRDDARKDGKLRAAGYTVLRFTDVEIKRSPGRFSLASAVEPVDAQGSGLVERGVRRTRPPTDVPA